MLRLILVATTRLARACRLWRQAPSPRGWWLLWEVSQRIAEIAWYRIPAYRAAIDAIAAEEASAEPRPGFEDRVATRIADDRVSGRHPRLPHSHNGTAP